MNVLFFEHTLKFLFTVRRKGIKEEGNVVHRKYSRQTKEKVVEVRMSRKSTKNGPKSKYRDVFQVEMVFFSLSHIMPKKKKKSRPGYKNAQLISQSQ